MTDTCKNCGRQIWPAGALSAPHMVHCWQSGGHECEGYAAGYTRGRRDGIDEGVRIAKEHSTLADMSERRLCSGDYDPFIDWSNVDAEAEKAKEQTR